MQQVLVFDLGGVLLPFDRQLRVDAMSRAFQIEPAAAETFFSSVADRLDRGQIGLAGLALKMAQLAGRDVTEDESRKLLLSVFETPNTVLWDFVASLRPAVTTAALSDNPSCVVDVIPRHDTFDAIFLSAELGMVKPAREIFAEVTRRLGVESDQITFVDDSASNIAAAQAFGWDTVQFWSNEQLFGELGRRGFER